MKVGPLQNENSVFTDLSPRTGFMRRQIHLSSTPRFTVGKSSGGWRLSAPREFHPSEDRSELPPLRVAVAGQEYHYPHRLSWPRREPPGGHGRLFSALAGEAGRRSKTMIDVLSLALPAYRGAVANVARNNGNVPDKWVFGCQGTPHPPPKRRTGGRFSLPSTCFLTQVQKV